MLLRDRRGTLGISVENARQLRLSGLMQNADVILAE
jgi:hypothetical protein